MNRYFEEQILNAGPVELVRLVYQCAIGAVREARVHLEKGRIEERSRAIVRAYAAIAELLAALSPTDAPELVARLRDLYFYSQSRLLEANLQQKDAPLAEVLGLLTTLEEGWAGVVKAVHEAELEREANSSAVPRLEAGIYDSGVYDSPSGGVAMNA